MKNIYTLIILLLALTTTLKAQVSEQEFQALKALYNATGGDNWINRTGWENINTTATKDDVTTAWKGIETITDGHITNIHLYNNNLTGTLPPEIGNCIQLLYLDLSSNKLVGPLPNSMSNLVKIKTILIEVNPLNCDFPNNILLNLPELQDIQLYRCGLTGTIGDIFNNLPSLMGFDITNNKITGEIPSSFSNLKNLSSAYFGGNLLSGNLPTLDSCASIMYSLAFGNNQFSGSIPESYSKLKRLQYFNAENNNLSGVIPEGLFTTALSRLWIHNNFFTFAGIEPVFNKINALFSKQYDSNNFFPLNQDVFSINKGDALTLSATTLSVYNLGGNNNRYKWFRNNVEVYSSNSPVYTVPASASTDAGVYRFEVTNTVVIGITLKSDNITISIIGGNDAPTDIALSSSAIDENFTGIVGTLSATDPDAGDTHTFSLTTGNGTNDKDNGKFSITGNELNLNSAADFEISPQLNILISVNDGNGGIFTKAFTITVNNVNEAPVFISQVLSKTIDENVANETLVLNLTAQDPEGSAVTYTITQGNENGAFGINGNQLVVANNTKLNYTLKSSYTLTVNASDGSLSADKTLTISLNKINQMPEVANATFNIDENSPNGTVVGTIVASDRENDPLTYSIVSGNELGAFGISENRISVANVDLLDYEQHPVFTLVVNVSDGVSNVQATLSININNVQELTDNDILSFSVAGMDGEAVINEANHTVTLSVRGVDISALTATFTLSPEATSTPASGTVFNFMSPQTITVTSQSGVVQEWTITVSIIVGVLEFEKTTFCFYPNPVSTCLHVSGVAYGNELSIFSHDGRKVFSAKASGALELINLDHLPRGNYVLMVKTIDKKAAFQIVKQ